MIKRNNCRARVISLLGVPAIAATAAPPESFAGGDDLPAGTLCPFGVRIDVAGKDKVIGPVTGTHKVISPNFKVTTTALDDSGDPVGEPVDYTATGTVFYTLAERPDGMNYYEVKATGQNLLFVPQEDGTFDLIHVVSNVNYAMELDKQTEVRSFSGAARQTNICYPLA